MATQVAFDPNKFRASVNGVPVFDPADISTAFVAEFDTPRSTVDVGMYGDAAITFTMSQVAKFRITLKGKSPTNDQFSVLANTRQQFSIAYVDRNTNANAAYCDVCAVDSMPPVTGGTAQENKEWVFNATKAQLGVGGNKTLAGR